MSVSSHCWNVDAARLEGERGCAGQAFWYLYFLNQKLWASQCTNLVNTCSLL